MYITDTQRALALWNAREAAINAELTTLREHVALAQEAEWALVDEGERESARALVLAMCPAWDRIIRLEWELEAAQVRITRLRGRLEDEAKGILWDGPVTFPQ